MRRPGIEGMKELHSLLSFLYCFSFLQYFLTTKMIFLFFTGRKMSRVILIPIMSLLSLRVSALLLVRYLPWASGGEWRGGGDGREGRKGASFETAHYSGLSLDSSVGHCFQQGSQEIPGISEV